MKEIEATLCDWRYTVIIKHEIKHKRQVYTGGNPSHQSLELSSQFEAMSKPEWKLFHFNVVELFEVIPDLTDSLSQCLAW
ncbi:unnamed protein product [Trichobilharzia szidati]|nr:unnamed protein product [Trichobilharzia szidati]